MPFAFYFLASLLAVFVESVMFQIPLTLIVIVFIAIFQRKEWIFPFTVGIGVLLDSLTFRSFGTSSFFFLCVIGLLYLYTRKFETHNAFFGVIFTLFASMFYLFLFSYSQFFIGMVWTLLLAVLLFSGSSFILSWRGKSSQL